MGEEKKPSQTDSANHHARVRAAFDAFHQEFGDRLDSDQRGTIEKLQDATSRKDAQRIREHLVKVREQHGWLYTELAKHPEIATLLDELALMGL